MNPFNLDLPHLGGVFSIFISLFIDRDDDEIFD